MSEGIKYYILSCFIFDASLFIYPHVSGDRVACSVFKIVDDLKFPISKQKCVFQVYSQSATECEILKYNRTECKNHCFTPSYDAKLSGLEIKSYQDHQTYIGISAFNFTFTNVEWQDLIFRIKHRGKEDSCFLQKLTLSPTKYTSSLKVQMACPIFSERYEDQEFDLEYTTHSKSEEESRHFALKMPLSKYIDRYTTPEDWQIFIYVDVTELPKLSVYWQTAPKHLGLTSYVVNVMSAETNSSMAPARRFQDHSGDKIMFTEYDESLQGEFYFTVQAEDCETLCRVSSSARIHIVPSSLMPFIIGGCVFSVLAAILCAAYLGIASYIRIPVTQPVVLIIYKRTLQPHIDAVQALAEYLRNACHVDAKIDEVDIPLTPSKNPFEWCQQTFESANAVMVISSPHQDSCSEVGIYRGVYEVGLRLVAENFTTHQKKYFSVVLPYCALEDIPLEAKNLKCFMLNDFDDMLWYINYGRKGLWLSRLQCILRGNIPGGKSDLYTKRQALLHAFRNAAKIITQNEAVSVTDGHEVNELEEIERLFSVMNHENTEQVLRDVPNEESELNEEEIQESIHAILNEREYLNDRINEERDEEIILPREDDTCEMHITNFIL